MDTLTWLESTFAKIEKYKKIPPVIEKGIEGFSLLALCVEQSKSEYIKIAVQYGAEIDLKNLNWGNQSTALMYAVSQNNIRCTKTLLSLGANPNILDKEGKNSLFYLTPSAQKEIIDLLIEKEVDPTVIIKTSKGPEDILSFHIKNGLDSVSVKNIEQYLNIYKIKKERENLLINVPNPGIENSYDARNLKTSSEDNIKNNLSPPFLHKI